MPTEELLARFIVADRFNKTGVGVGVDVDMGVGVGVVAVVSVTAVDGAVAWKNNCGCNVTVGWVTTVVTLTVAAATAAAAVAADSKEADDGGVGNRIRFKA